MAEVHYTQVAQLNAQVAKFQALYCDVWCVPTLVVMLLTSLIICFGH